jgi:acyl-CoA synthetase (AMP-forming)/AMP-acid ligase II
MTPLLSWLRRPDPDRGIRFATAGTGWEFWPYRRLAALVGGMARALVRRGVAPGDVVSVVEGGGPAFVGTLFGTLAAGATASPVAPPSGFGDPDGYRDHLDAVRAAARPALVVHAPAAVEVAQAAFRAGVPAVSSSELLAAAGDGGDALPPRDPAALALVQFTSGTSGRVRGVRVPYPALEANIAAIQDWLRMTPHDPTASWLPPYHDMGLVGCLLAPVVAGGDLWLLPPAEFVRRPARYLACFGRAGARLTAMPGFGLDHIVRRVRPAELSDMDFSAWRAVIVGAERIVPASLDRFHDLCAPRGLRRSALLPAYGLAEATLAVTGSRLTEEWTWEATAAGQAVVGCGRPLPGVRVAIHDDTGRPLPEGQLGEIVVSGPSMAAGYATGGAFPGGVVRTGDAGYLRNGQLFVLGRRGDAIKVRGRAIFAEDLDAALTAELGVPAGRAVTLLGAAGNGPLALVVIEGARPAWLEGADRVLRPHLGDVPLRTVAVPMGAVPRTSSGKPRRRELWRQLQDQGVPALAGTT